MPGRWAADIAAHLATGETTQAWLEIDLDSRLKFAAGLVLVTDRRLLARAPGEAGWQEWPLSADLSLNHHDQAGVGALELVDKKGRLASWRYTLANNLAALRVIAEFELHRDSLSSGQPVLRSTDNLCPKCKAAIPAGEDECPICNREATVSPSTWKVTRSRWLTPIKVAPTANARSSSRSS